MNYIVTSKAGMSQFASTETLAQAIAESVKARRQGLDGEIVGQDGANIDARPSDCDEAAQILGWERDPVSADMDMPINANIVAGHMVA